ncbi:MAG: metallophosphoesterase [Gammaproteobacteria bacterium]|nr:metallophosphoesterase [Gammaproteobacteria bacterium]
MKLVERLVEGPVDVIGDVHGELEGLENLLAKLGYDNEGSHPAGRHLVFVGDLVDRGPDSVGVLSRVMKWVNSGMAQAVLGNHELNLLRNDEKPDNLWFTATDKPSKYPARVVTEPEREALLQFLRSLPLVLTRSDLRIVHACWNNNAITALAALGKAPYADVAELYNAYEAEVIKDLDDIGVMTKCAAEEQEYAERITDPDWTPEFLAAKAEVDFRGQMGNPVAVTTSGEERITLEPFWAGGKWRMVDRVKWWDNYTDDTPVIFGHYWRRFGKAAENLPGFGPDLFADIDAHHWMGPRNNVYCIDFSVGARPALRDKGDDLNAGRLSALRMPEYEVIHDDGKRVKLLPPGGASSLRGGD